MLTGDQHTDHISNEQRVSRHSLPTLLYFLFSPTHIFFNSILASRTFGTFGFARHTSQRFAKPKEPNLPPHRDKDKNLKNKNNFAYFDELKMTFKNI